MACQKYLLPSGRGALLLFALFSLGLAYDTCDIGECRSVFHTAFSKLVSNDIDALCREMKQVLKCLNECQQIYFPYILDINTTVSLLKEVCDEEFVYDIADHWECVRNHVNKFFMCISRSSSIKSYSSKSSDGKLIACKMTLMILDCPEEVLSNHCEDEAVQIITQKLKTALRPWLNSSCYGISQNKVFNLDVNYGLKSDFDVTASCMDSHSYLVEDCFSEYLEKAATLKKAQHEYNLCWSNPELVCSKPISSIPCSPASSVANFYSSLFSYGKIKCKEPSLEFETPSDVNPTTTVSSQESLFTEELKPSTPRIQHPSSDVDSTKTIHLTEMNPSSFITDDLKQNDENTLPFFTSTANTSVNYSHSESSLNIVSSNSLHLYSSSFLILLSIFIVTFSLG